MNISMNKKNYFYLCVSVRVGNLIFMAFNEVIENFTRLKYDVDRHFIGVLNLVGSMVY